MRRAADPGMDPGLDPGLGLPDPLVDRLRHALLDDAEGSACDALGEDACTVAPGNAGWNVVSGAFSKLGEQLASPGTVLPWILSALGAPAAMTGLLVPVKDAGSLLPQLAVAGVLRSRPRRARWWVAAASLQTVALAAMTAAVAFLGGAAAGAMVVLALAAFSIASGVGSVAFKDVMAKTVPKGARGRVLAWRSAIGGIAGVAAGLTLRFAVAGAQDRGPYLVLLLAATACFAASAAAFARIREEPGATSGRRDALQEARAGMRLLREQPGFRAFVAARALLLAVPLTLPFLTVFGREAMQADLGGLGVFVAANAVAASVASPAWGRVADLASHRAMAVGGLIALAAVGYAFAATLLPEAARSAVAYVPVYLLAGIGYAGVRLGRKTYLVDAPPEDERPTYVAIANTAIGGATVLGAGVGMSAGLLGTPGTLLLFSAFTALGCLAAWRLPPAERMHVATGDAP